MLSVLVKNGNLLKINKLIKMSVTDKVRTVRGLQRFLLHNKEHAKSSMSIYLLMYNKTSHARLSNENDTNVTSHHEHHRKPCE